MIKISGYRDIECRYSIQSDISYERQSSVKTRDERKRNKILRDQVTLSWRHSFHKSHFLRLFFLFRQSLHAFSFKVETRKQQQSSMTEERTLFGQDLLF